MARFGDWKKCSNVMKGFEKKMERNVAVALLQSGLKLEGMIKERILQGKGMKKLHPFTIDQKESSKPLIDEADLVGSVNHQFIKKDELVVGVKRIADDGTNLAALHEREKGKRIKVTAKMRAYLHAKGLHLKKTTKAIFIPGRPYMKPAYRSFKDRGVAKKIFKQAVKKSLGGK